jgi:hypothetical protein
MGFLLHPAIFPKAEVPELFQIILIIAIAGIHKNIPAIPQRCSPIRIPKKKIKH